MKRILPLTLFILSGILHSQTISFLRNFDENLLSVISKDDNKYLATDKYSIFQLDENGFVETIMGRRRYLKDINSNNSVVRGYAERNAINAPIQGSSADIIKIAMIEIYKEFREKQLSSKMILQVHDELVFDVLKDELPRVKTIVEKKMINSYEMSVPLEVDINTGDNWLEAH